MRYSIHKEQKKAAYIQLYEQIREDIAQKIYRYGEKLPSKRIMAADVGVSLITVEHTYEILCEEGYIEPRERSGYFVCYQETDVLPVSGSSRTFRKIGNENYLSDNSEKDPIIGDGSGSSNIQDGFRISDGTEDVISWAEDMDETMRAGAGEADVISYSVLAKTMRKVLTMRGDQILQKSPGSGMPDLKQAIAAYLGRSRGIVIRPEQIVIGSGAEYLYSLIVQMLGREHIYALEDPSYEKIRRMYEANGAVCELLKMGKHGIHSSELNRSAATVLHVTPFNSFPSGVTATASKRMEYINWARKRNGIIIEDDFDSEFTVSSKAEETLFSLEPQRSVIYMNTFSKTISPSIRIGYMVLPEQLTGRFAETVGFYSSTVPSFEQYVLAELIDSGDFERHINRVRRSRRRKLLS